MCFLLAAPVLFAQPSQLTGPSGAVFSYQLQGDPTAANPRANIPSNLPSCGTPGWISYALTHQLTTDPVLFAAAQKITKKKKLCSVMSEVTMGAGYYLLCNNGNKDLKFTGENVQYLLHADTIKGEMFVAEYLGNTLLEVNRVYVGRKWFEEDPEPYEKPVVQGNPVCEEPAPATLPPVAVIVAQPESGTEPLEVQLDGTQSYDPDGGEIVSYQWKLGNGQAAEGPQPSTTYPTSGTYEVELVVQDDEGETHATTRQIDVYPNQSPTDPPIATILMDPPVGEAPFTTELSARLSYDPDGGELVEIAWAVGEGDFVAVEVDQSVSFEEPGTFPIRLRVTDDEGDTASTRTMLTVLPPQTGMPLPMPVPAPTPTIVDSCWMMLYTLRGCDEGVDTVGITPIRVACPGPPRGQVIWTDCCCDQVAVEGMWDKPERLQLAGGPVFNRFRGQLTEYSLGVNAQVRYRFGERQRLAAILDVGVFPQRRATPLDDRPFKWSALRDSIDPESGLPLVWYRGSQRATAHAGLGAEYAPWNWLYIQAIAGVERTFQQADISDPRKDPSNRFVGFQPETFWYEGRVGVRKGHLELYATWRFSEENRPFSLIPSNALGGSHNPRLDKSYMMGVSLFY